MCRAYFNDRKYKCSKCGKVLLASESFLVRVPIPLTESSFIYSSNYPTAFPYRNPNHFTTEPNKHASKPWTRSPSTRRPDPPNNDPKPPGHATAATTQPRSQHHRPTTSWCCERSSGTEPRPVWADGFDRCVSLSSSLLTSFTHPHYLQHWITPAGLPY